MGLERVGGAWLSQFLSFTLLLNYSWLSPLEGTCHLSYSYWPSVPLCHQRAKCRVYSLLCFESLTSHVHSLKFPRGSKIYVISTRYGNMDKDWRFGITYRQCLKRRNRKKYSPPKRWCPPTRQDGVTTRDEHIVNL
jgi:hypothetical protein